MDKHKPAPRHLDPEDPRHGTTAGYHAGCRGQCCKVPIAKAQKLRKHLHVNGLRSTIDSTGTRRRIQALMAIGYTTGDLAHEMGFAHRNNVLGILHGDHRRTGHRVSPSTYTAVRETYERLSMSVPEMTRFRKRTRTIAIRKGYAPPLAWDDIDNDPAPNLDGDAGNDIDEVKVQRVLDGQRQDCNRAERSAVLDRWTGTQAELNRITGWNVDRLLKERKAA